MNSPSGTVSEMPLTAGTSPNFLTMSLVNTAAIEPPRIQRKDVRSADSPAAHHLCLPLQPKSHSRHPGPRA